uniref:Phospholipase A2 n=1 Tax=Macrostomum lignano TaxID=282301 RepID=A0A1I8HIV4_9PLAT
MEFTKEFDPYQVFKVEQQPCQVLQVTVIKGRKITKGRLWDFIDKPDPYVQLKIPSSPTGVKRTSCIENNSDPMWNESFTFLLDGAKENVLIISLKEANHLGLDSQYGEVYYPLGDLKMDRMIAKTFHFDKNSCKPDLRFSLCLCNEEKMFRERRRKVVFEALHGLLPREAAPESLDEVPVIAVMGSGGGFRAMAAFSGVFNALESSGVLDCTTYTAALLSLVSGHPVFPPGVSQEVLPHSATRNPLSVQQSMLRLVSPSYLYNYVCLLAEKKRHGIPLSFTDFFGLMIGQTLIPDKDVSARIFQETPFGLPKYGCFQRTCHFGCKFFIGRLCREYEEPPLHFLMGIWGSAFTILVKDLLRREIDLEKLNIEARFRGEVNIHLSVSSNNSEPLGRRRAGMAAASGADPLHPRPVNKIDKLLLNLDAECKNLRSSYNFGSSGIGSMSAPVKMQSNGDSLFQFVKGDPPSEEYGTIGDDDASSVVSHDSDSEEERGILEKLDQLTAEDNSPLGWWERWRNSVFSELRLLNTMSGRAAMVHNFMRSLTVTKAYPIAPFTPTRPREAGFRFEDAPISVAGNGDFLEMFETDQNSFSKYMHVVDAGLAFNSPYPLVLRQQRGVDLILSFDFSGRKHDNYPPFKELLLAYKWALIRNVPFPHITLDKYEKKGMQEVYIFRDKENPRVPIIMHFVLVNLSFREFKNPNVRRTLQDELNFANFDIFGGEKNPYSTFNFVYSPLEFDRIASMMEYNTLNCLPRIKKCIAECIERRRSFDLGVPIDQSHMNDFLNMSANLGVNRHDAKVLGKYISQRETEFSLNSSSGTGGGGRHARRWDLDFDDQDDEDEEEFDEEITTHDDAQVIQQRNEISQGSNRAKPDTGKEKVKIVAFDEPDGPLQPPESLPHQVSATAPTPAPTQSVNSNSEASSLRQRRKGQRGRNQLRVIIPQRPFLAPIRRDCPRCSVASSSSSPSSTSPMVGSAKTSPLSPKVRQPTPVRVVKSAVTSSSSSSEFDTADEGGGGQQAKDEVDAAIRERLNEDLLQELQRFH